MLGNLGHGHPERVVEHEDRPLLGRQALEAAVELIAIVDAQARVGSGRCVHVEEDEVGREPPTTPGLRRSRR